MLRFLIILFALSYASPALADHAHEAFRHADHKDWRSARLEAKDSGEPLLIKVITWQYLLDPDSGASFDEITRFIEDNPNWIDQKKLRLRAEIALKNSNVADDEIISWFGDEQPITGIGKMALAEAYIRSKGASESKITDLIRAAWRGGDFDESQEKHILSAHGKLLRHEDDMERADRLLWEEKTTAARRLLSRVPADYQKLYKARAALIDDKHLSLLYVTQVPASLKKDPGLIYDRMIFRLRRDDDKGVREMLLAAPAHVPYPEKWWKIRSVQIRKAIGERNYTTAKNLLANHSQTDGNEFAEATWLQGWLQDEFLNEPEKAYDTFSRIYSAVRFPVSKARAAYWAGRAAERSGNEKTADNWYNSASAYPTTFYGQLASLKVHGTSPLKLPSSPSISSSQRHAFEKNELVKAARLCVEMDEHELARHIISYLIESADSDTETALATELGSDAGNINLSVHASKKALQQNVALIDIGYPTPKTPSGLPIERALTLAIIRQESEFDPHAHSPSGALGMMQLLPSTAKEVARKNGLKTSPAKLYEPAHNMTLGSHYLGRLINSYDGSWIMAIAAYNGGPGNVHRWVKTFGTPGNDADKAVNWIEKIPFDETRNYVQRVLENVQVYRALDDDSTQPKLAEDLMR